MDEVKILTDEDIRISIPVISTKRYVNMKAVKVKGMKEINEYIDAITWNNINYIRENSFYQNPFSSTKVLIFTKQDLDKSQSVELVQLNYLSEPDGNVSAIFTLGIILMKDINRITKVITK